MILFSHSRLHCWDCGTVYAMLYLCFVSLYYYREKKKAVLRRCKVSDADLV